MTLIPNFRVSGIISIILGLAVTIWAATRIKSTNGALVLIILSMMMLLVGGGPIPPVIGIVAGIISTRITQKDLQNDEKYNAGRVEPSYIQEPNHLELAF